MCGILFTDNPKMHKTSFLNALGLIVHRGPNVPLCYYEFKGFKLGHNRLSILDKDSRSSQPFFSRDGRYALIYNGEIYNYKELARKHQLETRTTSDTEVLVELYAKLGPKFLDELNGMFSFIILDLHTEQFFVARDRLGVKPLYYYEDGVSSIFASEVRPILELIPNATIDEIGLRQYRKLRTFFNGRTIYNQIKMFPAGHYMIGNKISKYWELPMYEKPEPNDDEIRYLVESAVEYRKISDVSVGSYLSGGLDSTLIAGLSQVECTWTVGFEESNEFSWAQLAADAYKTIHSAVPITKEEFFNRFKEIVNITKLPISVPNEVLLFHMTREVKKNNTVILSGEGADEIFYGYDRIFRWANTAERWDLQAFANLYSYGGNDDLDIVEDAIAPFKVYQKPLHILAAFFQVAHLHGLLLRLDRSTMLCSVEARCPFLDYRLIERLAGVSFEYKMKNGVVKAPLKRIFQSVIPNAILKREKVGFPVPLDKLMPMETPGTTWMDKWFDYNITMLMEGL